MDVVLGVPKGYWERAKQRGGDGPETFIDWLGGLNESGDFFGTVANAYEWRVERPWFSIPKGRGKLNAFKTKVDGGMLRAIDRATGGKPVFAVSGIPGTVGSGTREFWRELAPRLSGERDFAVWPFEGDLASLAASGRIVLCETYPRLAYAVALADELPTGILAGPKTDREWRNNACNRLESAAWVRGHGVDLGGLQRARANDDDFDALFTAAAALRCLLEGRALWRADRVDGVAEGSMLLAGVVDPVGVTGWSPRATQAEASAWRTHKCPIPGCEKVFHGSRAGWDAHVGSVNRHPKWRRETADPATRRRLFREEFRSWFA